MSRRVPSTPADLSGRSSAGQGAAAPPLSLHIERLVLDGVPLARGAGSRVQAAMTAELGRLLGDAPLRSDLRAGVALASLQLPGFTLEAGIEPERLGELMARALFGGLVP